MGHFRTAWFHQRSLRNGKEQLGRTAPIERDCLFPRREQALGQTGSGRTSQDAGSTPRYASHYGGEQTAQFSFQPIDSVSRTGAKPWVQTGCPSACEKPQV